MTSPGSSQPFSSAILDAATFGHNAQMVRISEEAS
jgi:hypothetical protein